MEISLKNVADFVGGKIYGNENLIIKSIAKIEEAEKDDLTFLYLPAYEKYFSLTKAAAILVKPGFNKTRSDISYIEVENPNTSFYKILSEYFIPEYKLTGIDSSASISPEAVIDEGCALGKNVIISAGCRIGKNVKIFHNTVLLDNVEIGEDCLLFQNISIRENCSIGNRVIIHPGTVIGSDGFGFTPDEKGIYHKIPQIGKVIIEDDVEIGSNVSIDRATIGATIIKKGVKIDNLVQIAHNVLIDENTVISAQAGISGSTKVGKNCILTGQVGLVGHIEIADNVIIGAQSGVSKSIKKAGQYRGSPAQDFKAAIKLEALVRLLPDYIEKINNLEKQLSELREFFKNNKS